MLEVLARIRHRRTRRQLSPYLDGMLSVQGSRRLEAHLAQCRACRDELEEMRATVRALAELPLVEAPRSFALAAAPRRIEAPRPARRAELVLRLATVTAAFVLTVVAVGDLLGLPGGDEEENGAVANMSIGAASPTEAGSLQEAPAATDQPDAEGAGAEDKALTEATPPAAGVGVQGSTPSPEGYGYGEGAQATTATPEPHVPSTGGSPETPAPGAETPAATATPAPATTPVPDTAAAPPATGPAPETPAPEATPVPEGTPIPAEEPSFYGYGLRPTAEAPLPTVTAETPAATATPLPVGARLSPSEPEGQLPAEADEQALAEAQRDALAAEEGGPSRETVVRWLEIGLASGLALLFVSWILARRRGWA